MRRKTQQNNCGKELNNTRFPLEITKDRSEPIGYCADSSAHGESFSTEDLNARIALRAHDLYGCWCLGFMDIGKDKFEF